MGNVDVQDAPEDKAVTETVTNEVQAEETPASVAEQQATAEPKPAKKKLNIKAIKVSRRTILEALLVVAVVGFGLWSWTLHSDNKNLKDQLSQVNQNPQIAVEQQTKDLLNKVGSLIQLPKDETPTIAAVTDAAKAKKQSAFFTNAQNGDKVLMYVKAGQAILYRPSTNKIVLVAPLTFSKAATTDSSTKTNDTNTTN